MWRIRNDHEGCWWRIANVNSALSCSPGLVSMHCPGEKYCISLYMFAQMKWNSNFRLEQKNSVSQNRKTISPIANNALLRSVRPNVWFSFWSVWFLWMWLAAAVHIPWLPVGHDCESGSENCHVKSVSYEFISLTFNLLFVV